MKKKFYGISTLSKAKEICDEERINQIEGVVAASIFGLVATITVGLPLMPIVDSNMLLADKVKSLLLGLTIPGVAYPLMAKNILKAIKSKNLVEKYSKFIQENKRDIGYDEMDERIHEKHEEQEIKKCRKLGIEY